MLSKSRKKVETNNIENCFVVGFYLFFAILTAKLKLLGFMAPLGTAFPKNGVWVGDPKFIPKSERVSFLNDAKIDILKSRRGKRYFTVFL